MKQLRLKKTGKTLTGGDFVQNKDHPDGGEFEILLASGKALVRWNPHGQDEELDPAAIGAVVFED
jgi:hypothetical protein